MNGIERITARLDADTQAEIDRIRENAKAEAEKVAQGYRTQMESETSELRERSRPRRNGRSGW